MTIALIDGKELVANNNNNNYAINIESDSSYLTTVMVIINEHIMIVAMILSMIKPNGH